MANKVNLDAMIPRADFGFTKSSAGVSDKIQSLGVEQLNDTSIVMKNLRKPDFQRETNHWDASQLVNFLTSFVDRELIPSVILWQSPSYIFVIDGAHRLSALRAWIEDDYGDGPISQKFYEYEVSDEQIRSARTVRKKIESTIGSFKQLRLAVGEHENENLDEQLKYRASVMTTRSFSLQWVEGDAKKAETSFFKINTQGTPLHKTEERLLRSRLEPLAIVARSIYRAGTGNKYWSHFEEEARLELEELAKEAHVLIFRPELNQPVKTLDLPLAGSGSALDSLNLLMDMIEEIHGKNSNNSEAIKRLSVIDENGSVSIDVLKTCLKTLRRITGDKEGSLGLHPAVYFYNNRGKHSQHLFIAITSIISLALRNNDKRFFRNFSDVRSRLEELLVEHKSLIGMAITNIYSQHRISRIKEMFQALMICLANGEDVGPEQLIDMLGLKGKLVASDIASAPKDFSKAIKSEIYLRDALDSAAQCSICGGMIDASKSVSYDHILRKEDGGSGVAENGQLTHPYCNNAMKG